MFNSITGVITYKDEERVFLSAGAVEWEIHVSRSSSDDLPEEGQKTKVYVYLHHRDDQLKLFGFSQSTERDVFLDLLKVEGVGPRQSLKILSGVEVGRFIEALDSEDLDLLSGIPGVGKKTAQKIMLKLKGKLTVTTPAGISMEEDILNALVGLGFDRRSAKGAVNTASRTLRESDLDKEELERELFKTALSQLSGGSASGSGFQAGSSGNRPPKGKQTPEAAE